MFRLLYIYLYAVLAATASAQGEADDGPFCALLRQIWRSFPPFVAIGGGCPYNYEDNEEYGKAGAHEHTYRRHFHIRFHRL